MVLIFSPTSHESSSFGLSPSAESEDEASVGVSAQDLAGIGVFQTQESNACNFAQELFNRVFILQKILSFSLTCHKIKPWDLVSSSYCQKRFNPLYNPLY